MMNTHFFDTPWSSDNNVFTCSSVMSNSKRMSPWSPGKRFYWYNCESHSLSLTVTWQWKANNFVKTKSLPQRRVCVGCQPNSDQVLKLLCLKGNVGAQARGSTLWRHQKQFNSCVLNYLFFDRAHDKGIAKNPGNALSDDIFLCTKLPIFFLVYYSCVLKYLFFW